MDTLGDLQSRLTSLEELRSIVRTMKALSAASIRQYEHAAQSLPHYYRTVEYGLQAVLRSADPAAGGLTEAPGEGPAILVAFGSDHGLCGRFNEALADHLCAQAGGEADRRMVLAVGARIAAALEQRGEHVRAALFLPASAEHITDTVQNILLTLDAWRAEARDAGRVSVFGNRPARGRDYSPGSLRLLPVDPAWLRRLADRPWPSRSLPAMTMARPVLFSRLLRQYLFVSLFRACAESQASEHAARLAAMQSAERSLDERREEVTSAFRRARQSAITAELLEVVSGFEAIEPE